MLVIVNPRSESRQQGVEPRDILGRFIQAVSRYALTAECEIQFPDFGTGQFYDEKVCLAIWTPGVTVPDEPIPRFVHSVFEDRASCKADGVLTNGT